MSDLPNQSLFQSLASVTLSPLGSLLFSAIVATLGASGLLGFFFKHRSDRSTARIKSGLEFQFFHQTLGKVRADEQQAEAIKLMWTGLANYRNHIAGFVVNVREFSRLIKPTIQWDAVNLFNSRLPEWNARLGDQFTHIQHELVIHAMHVDAETYALCRQALFDVQEKLVALFQRGTEMLKVDGKFSVQNVDAFFAIYIEYSFEDIDAVTEPLLERLRVKLKLVEPGN